MEDNTIKFMVPDDAAQEMKVILSAVYRSLSEKVITPSTRSSAIFSPRTRRISPTTTTPGA